MAEANPRRVFHPDLEAGAPDTPEPEPAPAPALPAPTVEQEPEEEQVPESQQTVFVGGREQTVDEVVANYAESSKEAQKLREELARERAQREIFERDLESLRNPPPQPQVLREPDFDEADPQAIRDWVRQLAEQQATQIANERVTAQTRQLTDLMTKFQQLTTAEQEMKQYDPSFDTNTLREYLAANPSVQDEYNELFAVKPTAALKYAWSQIPKGSSPESPRAAQQPAKRKAPAPTAQDKRKRLRELLLQSEATGDERAYLRERFKGTSVDRDFGVPSR